jgi:hypothetical protein
MLDQYLVTFPRLGFVPLLVSDVFPHMAGVCRIIIGQLPDGFHRKIGAGIRIDMKGIVFITELLAWKHPFRDSYFPAKEG